MPEKKSLAELRKELKEMRKEAVKPVSRMRKGDISAEIERMRGMREETAPVASVLGASAKKSRSEVETIKEAKAKEFPMKPSEAKPARSAAAAKALPAPKKKSKLERLMEMADEMTSDEEE